MKKVAVFAAGVVFLAGTSGALAADKKTAGQAIYEAVQAAHKAEKANNEWRFTYKYIGKAKAAYRKGDYAKALSLAKVAKQEGELAAEQAKSEANADIPDYVYATVK